VPERRARLTIDRDGGVDRPAFAHALVLVVDAGVEHQRVAERDVVEGQGHRRCALRVLPQAVARAVVEIFQDHVRDEQPR